MKNIINYILVVLIFSILLFTLTGCGKEKRKSLTYTDEENKVKVIFNIKEDFDYKISENEYDFRTSREDAILIADTFSIGIEVSDELSSSLYNGEFEKYAEEHKNEDEYTEVVYNGVNGFSNYYEPYLRYEVFLPVKNSDKYLVKFTIYSNNKSSEQKDVKEQYESEKVQDILNNIQISIFE